MDEYKTILEEMLDLALAGVPLDEQEKKEDEKVDEPEGKELETEPEEPVEPEATKGKEDEEPEEELHDEWEKKIRTGSNFKIQIHENYLYVWYRNKKSAKIQIPPKIRQYRELFSSLLDKIMSHMEKVS